MADETTLPEGANVEDAIADLLTGGEDGVEQEVAESSSKEEKESKKEEESTEDSNGLEEATEESTDEDESNEEESETEDEEEATWASTLGVDDSNIVLDDKGDFAGVNVKVDGEQSSVGVKDLIAGYQTNKHNTNTSKRLADDRREFEGIRDNAVDVYTKKLNDITKLSEYMHSSLMSEYEGVNWQQLRAENPAEYAALMQDFNKRNSDIQEVYSAIESERGEADVRHRQVSTETLNKRNKQELDKVKANNPEWDTDVKLGAALNDIGSFVNETYGVAPEEFNSLSSASYIEIMKDAMAYRKGAKVVQKKLKAAKLPKYQKSKGTVTKKRVSKLDKLTKAAKSATGANKRELETDAIAALISGV